MKKGNIHFSNRYAKGTIDYGKSATLLNGTDRECPKKAISFGEELNEKGYKTVIIDDEKCVGCGVCYHMCPDCVLELEG